MTDGKKSLVLYHDIRQPLELLTDEQRGKLFMALLDYSEYGADPGFSDPALSMAFSFIRAMIDRDSEKWERTRQRRSQAGRKGAEVTNGKARQTPANPAKGGNAELDSANPAVNVPVPVSVPVNVPVPVNVSVINGESRAAKPPTRSRFVPPSVDEVRGYAEQEGFSMDAERFVDYYKAKGWKIGNASMKDWKAAARNWERRDKEQATPTQNRNAVPSKDDYTGWE